MDNKNHLSNKVCPEGMTIEEWQVALRRETALTSGFVVAHQDNNRIWGDYTVNNGDSQYRVAFRGVRSDRNYCSCLDFRTNGLGTCKHLEAVILMLQQEVDGYPWAGLTFQPEYSSIYVSYKGGRSIRMRIGSKYTEDYKRMLQRYFDSEGILRPEYYESLHEIKEEGLSISSDFRLYDDVYDVVYEWVNLRLWQDELEASYPEHRIPWDKVDLNPQYQELESLLYNLCYRSYGFLIGREQPLYPHLIARLVEEVYQGEEIHQQAYVVLERDEEVREWRQIFAQYSEAKALPIVVVTEKEFTHKNFIGHNECTFVYVDRAEQLKEWKNPLSLSVKKLKIKHLYMRAQTIERFTPVQLSSILQHISPFIIGPFYHFIHTYRPLFPLSDTGSNFPLEIKHLTFLCGQISLPDGVSQPPISAETLNISDDPLAEEKVLNLMRSLKAVLDDPNAREQLRSLLGRLV